MRFALMIALPLSSAPLLVRRRPGAGGWRQRSKGNGSTGIPADREILLAAMVRFPQEAMISYHLAGCAVEVGDLADAWDCLHRAIGLNESLRQRAMDDPDLAPLWPGVKWP